MVAKFASLFPMCLQDYFTIVKPFEIKSDGDAPKICARVITLTMEVSFCVKILNLFCFSQMWLLFQYLECSKNEILEEKSLKYRRNKQTP